MADAPSALDNVAPGDFVTMACPEGGTVPFKVGDAVSRDDKGQATAKVIRIEGESVMIGVLRAGEFNLSFECPGAPAKVTRQFRVVPLDKDNVPPPGAPLAPITFAYPIWFWVLLALVALALVTLAFGVYRRLSRRFAPAPSAAGPRKINPVEAFENYLLEVERTRLDEKNDDESTQALYGQGYERLRRFLEHRYGLKTVIETTREFLGSLRAAAPTLNVPAEAVSAIDELLSTADRVRFAKSLPPVEERRQFTKRLRELFQAMRPRETAAPTTKDFR